MSEINMPMGYKWQEYMGDSCIFCKLKENDWLERRRKHISASDAACVIGIGFKSNVELWEEKTGMPISQSHSPQIQKLMQKGTEAESHIRELYAIDHDIEEIYDGTLVLCESKSHPFMSCTLDAWFIDADGEACILEIKRSEHAKMFSREEYPLKYRAQILHQMMVTGIHKAVLCPYVYWTDSDGYGHSYMNEYRIDSSDDKVKYDMEILLEKEKEFWDYVERKERPPKIIL